MPQQLQAKPEADALTFGKYFTDHMMKVFWHKCLGGWQRPEITPMENLVIHPAAKVLHYAVEVNSFLLTRPPTFDINIVLVQIPLKKIMADQENIRFCHISLGVREEIANHDQIQPCFRL